MSISIVIPTRNRPADLLRVVESIVRQRRLPDELLIVDQSKDDTSENMVTNVFAAHRNCIALKYIHDDSIPGLVAAKAAAVPRSSGDIILFLEDDVVLEEDYIQNMASMFLNRPEMMGACGVVSDVPRATVLYRWLFHIFHRGIFCDKRVGIHGNKNIGRNEMIPSNYLSGGVSAYRRKVFERVPFDTQNDFFMLEDIDFSTRAVREFGEGNFIINTSARLSHLMSPVNRAKLATRHERKVREFICFYKKNHDQRWALITLSWLLVGLFLEASIASLNSMHHGPVFGYYKGLLRGVQWKIKPLDIAQ